jgi:ArsR family metal-binding transcriptional regulator
MTGDLMDKVFGDIKSKKRETETAILSKEGLSNETLSIKAIDLKVLQDSIDATTTKRRMIGVWDPEIAAAMQYLKSVIPRYSISESAAKWIKEGLERDHPELIQKVQESLKKSSKL